MPSEMDGLPLRSFVFSSLTQEVCSPANASASGRPAPQAPAGQATHPQNCQEGARGRHPRGPPPLAAEGSLAFFLRR